MSKATIVKEGDFFGLVDKDDNKLLECIYHSVFKINRHLFGYRNGIRFGIIKVDGQIVIPPVLNGMIEQELFSNEYENSIDIDPPIPLDNPFTHKLTNEYVKYYNGVFIEEQLKNYNGENYIISQDNLGKAFICDLKGNILLHKKLDHIWKVDMDSWFVIFINRTANFWNCKTDKYLFNKFLPANDFYQDSKGQINFTYNDIDYRVDIESIGLKVINAMTGKIENYWA